MLNPSGVADVLVDFHPALRAGITCAPLIEEGQPRSGPDITSISTCFHFGQSHQRRSQPHHREGRLPSIKAVRSQFETEPEDMIMEYIHD
jgi:hypothetical protein